MNTDESSWIRSGTFIIKVNGVNLDFMLTVGQKWYKNTKTFDSESLNSHFTNIAGIYPISLSPKKDKNRKWSCHTQTPRILTHTAHQKHKWQHRLAYLNGCNTSPPLNSPAVTRCSPIKRTQSRSLVPAPFVWAYSCCASHKAPLMLWWMSACKCVKRAVWVSRCVLVESDEKKRWIKFSSSSLSGDVRAMDGGRCAEHICLRE